jgi:hypothetical protein
MKTRSILMAAAMTLTALASTRAAQAQAQDQLVITIPFDFAAGSASLPAGDYSVKVISVNHTLMLMNRDNPRVSMFLIAHDATSAKPQTQSKLVFNRYGDRYFLSQVWVEGSELGKELPKSSREKEIAVEARLDTRDQIHPTQVVLVASR